MLLVTTYGEPSLREWREHFGRLLPNLPVAAIDDASINHGAVDYVFVYNPPPGRLAQLPNLKLILSMGAGVDHIVRDPLWPAHVPIVRMGDEKTAQRMGEYVCMAALMLLRDMPRAICGQREQNWDHFETARDATETTVGVMGLGNLGIATAAMLRKLGFKVMGWSRSCKSIDGVHCFAGPEDRDAFLARSDILVCLLPDTPATRGILDAQALALLPTGAGVINVARGSHLILDDLVEALDSGHLGGAVLDVFDAEPLPSNASVWGHPRIVVTPHIGSLASRLDRASYAAEVITRFEGRQALPNLYDAARGY